MSRFNESLDNYLINKMRKIRKNKSLLAIICVFILCSCTKEVKEQKMEANIIEIEKLPEFNPFVKDGMLDSCKFVRLETNPSCLLAYPKKILITDSLIFIFDENKKLFAFDINGNFKNSIGTIGNGPKEMLLPSGFYINSTQKEVVIFDAGKSKAFIYNYQGKFLKHKNVPNSTVNDFTDLAYLNDGNLLLQMSNYESSRHNFRLLDVRDYKLVDNILSYPCVGRGSSSFGYPKIAVFNTSCFVTTLFSDTIYKYHNNQFVPSLIIKSSKKVASAEVINEKSPFNVCMEPERELKSAGYSTGLTSIYQTKDYLFFPYYIDGNLYQVFWNVSKQKGFVMKNHNKNHNDIFTSFQMGNLFAVTDNALVFLVSAYDVDDFKNSKQISHDKRVVDIIKDHNIEDNPILAFYYIGDSVQSFE